MAPTSPTVARWELALRLKARRDELGLSVKTITEHLSFSRNYWSAVENERTVLADEKFDALMELMEFDEGTIAELSGLHAASRKRGWWANYPGLDDDMERFFGLEAGATEVRAFEGLLMPGLLQTPAYTRAVIEADPFFPRVEVDRLVELRMRRQKRIFDSNPLQLTAVLSEAALYQHVGSPETQKEQLKHVRNVLRDYGDTVQIRVVPFSEPLGPLITSSTLLLMDFASDHLPTVGWQEAIRPLGLINDEEQLRRAILGFNEVLSQRSLDATATLENLTKT